MLVMIKFVKNIHKTIYKTILCVFICARQYHMAPTRISGPSASMLITESDRVMRCFEKVTKLDEFRRALIHETGCDLEVANQCIRTEVPSILLSKLNNSGIKKASHETMDILRSHVDTLDILLDLSTHKDDIVKRIKAQMQMQKNRQLEKPTVAPEITRDDQLATIRATGITSGALNHVIKTNHSVLLKSDQPLSKQQIIEILNSALASISSPDCKSFKGKNAAQDRAECVSNIEKYIADLTPQQPSSSNAGHTKQSTDATPAAGST